MSRLMSVAMTTDAVIERRKTVTRRKGWWTDKNGRRLLKVGDTLTLCRKVQGRKPGEPIERLAEVEVVSIRRVPLGLLCPRHNLADLADRRRRAEQDRQTDAAWLAALALESTPVYDALVCESIEKAEGWA